MATIPVSVQLYTVRDLIAKDFARTVKKVAEVGYTQVEMAGYGNLKTVQEAKKALDDAGLKVSGSHAPIDVLEKELEKILDENEVMGSTNLICPWMPEPLRKDGAGWKACGQVLTKIGRA